MSGKFWKIAAGSLAGAALGYWGWTNRRRFFVNDITTGESAAYPELRSRVYYADVAHAMAAGEQALRRLPRWKEVSRDTENDALEAEVRTPLGPFTDDVTIYFFPLGHGQTRVTIRSRSRVGPCDLGQNAAHIRELQGAMDDRLNADAAF
ncbi:MAG: DUF1499 domain-containing protein [Armatimonadota bacterium]|nr:DUF1499 domain-containing protein [Armatimonadota bacterium]